MEDESRSSIVRAHFENIGSNKIIQSLKRAGVFVSRRGDSIRFSPHLYNYMSDIDKALAEIDNILVQ